MSDISNVLRKVIELDISLGLDGTQEALDEITRLTAENEKLRAALEKINVGEGWAALIARAALEGR